MIEKIDFTKLTPIQEGRIRGLIQDAKEHRAKEAIYDKKFEGSFEVIEEYYYVTDEITVVKVKSRRGELLFDKYEFMYSFFIDDLFYNLYYSSNEQAILAAIEMHKTGKVVANEFLCKGLCIKI